MPSALPQESMPQAEKAALGGRRATPLADDVAYYTYNKKGGEYTLSSRAQVLAGDYLLSAWCDALPSAGGRVRVVPAQIV